MKSIQANTGSFSLYGKCLDMALSLVIVVFAFGYADSSLAKPPNCDDKPNHPQCGSGGGEGGDVVFDVLLLGDFTTFEGVLPGKMVCGTNGPLVISGRFEGGQRDLGPSGEMLVTSWLDDQVFGVGIAVLKASADESGVQFFNTNNPTNAGGTNRVSVPGGDEACTGMNPTANHADVRLSIDANAACMGDVCLSGFRAGTGLDNNKYAKCAFEPFSSPVPLNLVGTTTIDLFHRCTIEQHGKGTALGTLSWGTLVMTARP